LSNEKLNTLLKWRVIARTFGEFDVFVASFVHAESKSSLNKERFNNMGRSEEERRQTKAESSRRSLPP
jgi:hypothetical protein